MFTSPPVQQSADQCNWRYCQFMILIVYLMKCGRLEDTWHPPPPPSPPDSGGGLYSLSLFLSLLMWLYLAGLCGTVCVCPGWSSVVSKNRRGQRLIWSLQMLQHSWESIGPVQCFIMCWGGGPPVSTLLSEFGSFRLRRSLHLSFYLQIMSSVKVRSSTPALARWTQCLSLLDGLPEFPQGWLQILLV